MTEHYATGGFVSGPKPGAPSLVPDGCAFWRPERAPEMLPGLTIQVNAEVSPVGEIAEKLRRWMR